MTKPVPPLSVGGAEVPVPLTSRDVLLRASLAGSKTFTRAEVARGYRRIPAKPKRRKA